MRCEAVSKPMQRNMLSDAAFFHLIRLHLTLQLSNFHDSRPPFNGLQPGFDDSRPSFDGLQPGFDDSRPGFDGLQPLGGVSSELGSESSELG